MAVDRDAVAGRFMEVALSEGARGLGRTSPNPPVGCVIVKRGRVVGRGWHRKAGLPHAEIEALRMAGKRARGADVYVTLEPCRHHGRTPPCTDALIKAGVARVFAGTKDPDPRVSGRGIRALRGARIVTRVGVRERECRNLIADFAHWVRTGQPRFCLKLAASLDGRIATRSGASQWISSASSRAVVQEMRNRADVVLVGVGTVLTDDPRLTCRRKGGRNPVRVVLDGRLRTPVDARVVSGGGRLVLVARPGASQLRRRRLEDSGAEVVELRGKGPRLWPRLAKELGGRGLHSVLVEGGMTVATSLIAAKMVNSLRIFYNPRLIGSDGIAIVGPLKVRSLAQSIRFRTVEWKCLGEDMIWTGEPR